jgi:hypothetical protein
MKRKEKLITAFAILSTLFISCNSNDDTNCDPDFTGALTQTEQVLVGKWILTAIVSDKEVDLTDDDTDNPSTNLYSQSTNCKKDIFYSFNESRVMKFVIGSTAENCSNKSESTSSWEFKSGTLSFVQSCLLFQSKIDFATDNLSFSNVENNVSIKEIDDTVVTVKLTYTYTKEID